MPLTFFQRHFTRPVDSDPEKSDNPQNRRFAFASKGFIVSSVTLLLLLIGAIAAAISVTLLDKHRREEKSPYYGAYGTGNDITMPGPTAGDPVKLAINTNFPDPSILYVNGMWYAWATNSASGILHQVRASPQELEALNFGKVNIQLATSKDFHTWDIISPQLDALPTVGAWALQGNTTNPPIIPKANTWAPSIIQRPSDKKFLMYYSSTIAGPPVGPHHPPPHCTGVAISLTPFPNSTFTPEPSYLFCPSDQAGAIDPGAFVDTDGKIYVSYKIDGNSMGHGGECGNMVWPYAPTPIMLQKMQDDGVTKDGDAVEVLSLDHNLDGPLIEAPDLVRSPEGVYFLFFSSGCTRAPSYDLKYATSRNVMGPYTRAEGNLLRTGDYGLLAPGSAGVVEDGKGGFRMAFHARTNGTLGGVRAMYTVGVKFEGEKVVLEDVSSSTL